jgi:excinuclease ABC subunit C
MSLLKSNELTKQLAAVPDASGVYIFKDELGEIIYIGKALSLRSRVRSYWNDNSWHERPKLAVMIPKVCAIDTILTNSEKEALLLEATLIKQHHPRYNVSLRDDKRYPWLAITYDVAYPRLVMVRDPVRYRKDNPRARVFGPYVESGNMWQTVKVLRKVFPMRQRRTPLFKDRPCMNYYIGLCLGPCQKLVPEDAYERMVKQVEMFLAGRQREVVAQLKGEMEGAAERLEFEQAAKIRNRLQALERMIEKQQVFFESQKVNQDIIAESHTVKLISISLLKVREGKMISAETVTLPLVEKTGWDEAYQSFIDQYYTSCEDIAVPTEVVLQHVIEDQNALLELLNSKAAHAVKITVPQRGGKTSMIEMAQKNAAHSLETEISDQTELNAKLESVMSSLQADLGLSKQPRRIECFDISNIQGTDNVASMVVFENAASKKSDYRTFKIRSVEGEANDFASMKEVVSRRYHRILLESKTMPDLIIIDGGKGQLNAACEALSELNIEVDIIGLAKKQEEVYRPGRSEPIFLPRRSAGLHLLQRVRDEAHRFAVTFHRKLRAKRSVASNLDLLPGVGKARRKIILDHFGSFDKVKLASLDELKAVPGLPKNVAQSIYGLLHPAVTDENAKSAQAAGSADQIGALAFGDGAQSLAVSETDEGNDDGESSDDEEANESEESEDAKTDDAEDSEDEELSGETDDDELTEGEELGS